MFRQYARTMINAAFTHAGLTTRNRTESF